MLDYCPFIPPDQTDQRAQDEVGGQSSWPQHQSQQKAWNDQQVRKVTGRSILHLQVTSNGDIRNAALSVDKQLSSKTWSAFSHEVG